MAQVPTQLDGPALNRHRYYDPSSGRFVSKDPLGLAGGINAYQYVPNPISWIDPLGWACSRPSGYCVNDADQHGNLSPQPNLAPGNRWQVERIYRFMPLVRLTGLIHSDSNTYRVFGAQICSEGINIIS
ncbi:RHS repeat-associated core domain-containing protein [Burkholderia cenocepacia]|nr:RHS repeat-associated core domain-containing protein [Burkholderia cenocepacia]RQU99004.1 RHS repeat-associated core domain-containing protein [Burkholderia cenocepacia]